MAKDETAATLETQTRRIIGQLKALGDPDDAAGKARFGINTEAAFGIRIPVLRQLAKEIGKSHDLAGALWATGYHEARILATMIDDPRQVTPAQMEDWVADFNSWDLCDQCCNNLFVKTGLATAKAFEWAEQDAEFVRRAGFVLMAQLAVHAQKAENALFEAFLEVIGSKAGDERNFVKKAVNWALRQIGKRNLALNQKALTAAHQIRAMDSASARWIAGDAIRELEDPKIRARIK